MFLNFFYCSLAQNLGVRRKLLQGEWHIVPQVVLLQLVRISLWSFLLCWKLLLLYLVYSEWYTNMKQFYFSLMTIPTSAVLNFSLGMVVDFPIMPYVENINFQFTLGLI